MVASEGLKDSHMGVGWTGFKNLSAYVPPHATNSGVMYTVRLTTVMGKRPPLSCQGSRLAILVYQGSDPTQPYQTLVIRQSATLSLRLFALDIDDVVGLKDMHSVPGPHGPWRADSVAAGCPDGRLRCATRASGEGRDRIVTPVRLRAGSSRPRRLPGPAASALAEFRKQSIGRKRRCPAEKNGGDDWRFHARGERSAIQDRVTRPRIQ